MTPALDPDLIARARQLYEETEVSCDAIAAMLGLAVRTFHTRRKTWGWIGRLEKREMEANRMSAAARLSTAHEPEEATPVPAFIAADIRAAVEREVAQTERRLRNASRFSTGSAEAERNARTLASLVKTLNELKRLEADGGQKPKDQDEPRDLDEFRRELARRLEALCEEEEGG